MAKKKVEQNTAPIKPMSEMTDSEFITYAEYLSSPYYRQYMAAKSGNVATEGAVQQTATPVTAPAKKGKGKKVKEEKLYVKKRGLFLFLILLLTLVVVAVAVVGYIDIEGISDYAALYVNEDSSISMADPIIGMVKTFVDLDMESAYYDGVLAGNTEGADILTLVTIYAVPVACLLAIVFALIAVIKAFVALCSGKKDGYYKKFKFGFLSVAILLCGLIAFVGGLYVSGTSLVDVLTFVTGEAAISAGYGLYALIALPVLTLIFSCVSYKRLK